jgi:AcrR family transcriptional regulator
MGKPATQNRQLRYSATLRESVARRGTGKRHRHKSKTLDELIENALRLFSEAGFEETTVDAIAQATGVSRRTFFRYFSSKDDLVLSQFEAMRTFLHERLVERPPSEQPLRAMRNSFKALDNESFAARNRRRRLGELVGEHASLRGAMLLLQEQWEAEIAEVVAQRLKLPATDARARLTAACGYAAFRLASTQSRLNGDLKLGAAIDRYFDLLEETGRSR